MTLWEHAFRSQTQNFAAKEGRTQVQHRICSQDLQQKPRDSWQKTRQEDTGMASRPGGNGSTFFTPRDKLLVYLTLPRERPGQTDV